MRRDFASDTRDLQGRSLEKAIARPLDLNDTYLCPMCRHGELSALALMEAYSCNFCRHIFTANLREQTLQVADSSQRLAWRWDGRQWRSARQGPWDTTILLFGVGITLTVLPTALVLLSGYMFPPLPGSRGAWLPLAWAGLTFCFHLGLVAWLVAEHCQFPLYVTSKVRLQQYFSRA